MTTASAPAFARTITMFLRHPATMTLKRHLRDMRWSLKGRNIATPKLPAGVKSMLFVCLGNICRSPFAELIARRRLAERGVQVLCASAGINPRQGDRSPADACRAASSFGISLDVHIAQPLTAELLDAHDAVIVMEASQLEQLARMYPHARHRLLLLPLFEADEVTSAYERYNIEDPFSQPLAAFEACYRRIDRAVSKMLTAMNLS